MTDLALSDKEYLALQEGLAAWLERQQVDPDAIWKRIASGEGVLYPDPVIDVPVVEESVGGQWTVTDKLALFLTGVVVVVLGGAGVALLANGDGWWSLVSILDVVLLVGFAVWLYRDRIRPKGRLA